MTTALLSRRLKKHPHDELQQHIVVLVRPSEEEDSLHDTNLIINEEDEGARRMNSYEEKKCQYNKGNKTGTLFNRIITILRRWMMQIQQRQIMLPSRKNSRCYSYCHYDHRSKLPLRYLLQGIVSVLILVVLNHWIKKFIVKKDPYLYALYDQPLLYIQLRYLNRNERPRKSTLQNYTMTKNNSFVISLLDNSNTNLTRYKRFQDMNRVMPAVEVIQRFNAIRWPLLPSSPDDSHHTLLALQQKYPFIKHLIHIQRYGDIGCFLSHIQLFQQLVKSKTEKYYFIFEDDAKFDQRVPQGIGQSMYVQAPNDADIIALTRTAMERVNVPFIVPEDDDNEVILSDHRNPNTNNPNDNNDFVIRVIGGYGGYAYIITKSGASSLIEYYSTDFETTSTSTTKHKQQQQQHDPIDVVMMNSHRYEYFTTTTSPLKAYYSHRGVTEIHHVPDPNFTSTRKYINKNT